MLQYFETAEANKSVPLFDNLWENAQLLFKRYGHLYAFEDAIRGQFSDDESQIPHGDIWVASSDTSSAQFHPSGNDNNKRKGRPKKGKKKVVEDLDSDDEPQPFNGDQTLAQSCRFLYDATVSREVIYATADGDIGRVWEVLKVSNWIHLLFFQIN